MMDEVREDDAILHAMGKIVDGPERMKELLLTKPGRFYKHTDLGLVPEVWNHCDNGTLMVFPSAPALKGMSGSWLCAMVFKDEIRYRTALWSPMFARGNLSLSGLVPHGRTGEFQVFYGEAEAKAWAYAEMREKEAVFRRGKVFYKLLLISIAVLVGLGVAAAVYFN